jgi:hypothetical protein
MLEFLFEFLDLYALYPIYAGIIIGFILNSLWVWATDESYYQVSNRLELTILASDRLLQKKSRDLPHPLLVWLIKFIRNKSGSTDEPVSFNPLPY